MSLIEKISVQNIRVHSSFVMDVFPATTVITGANGSGKTSIIEALYVALQGSSFKGSDNDVLRSEASWYRIDVLFEDAAVRTVKFDPSRSSGKKQFIIDGKTYYRLPQQHKYPVVIFEPEDLRLLNGSPVRRRQFIDHFISQLDPQYATSLRRYERALKQRNALLKQRSVSDSLFVWNVALSEYGAYIINQRIRFCDDLNARLNDVYASISHTKDSVTVQYSQNSHENIAQKLLSELHDRVERDTLLGFTSVGPHRHDILFNFNGSPALSVASRGEVRSIVLALKFLEVDTIKRITGKKPVILLDDVFSELDERRQNQLISLTKENQIIITSATNDSNIHTDYIIEL
ncbi:MAG: recF [Candidatus Saccharibacteria bacterium]|nr:recF [Candidatus Saccharibacteria bacterium]